MIEQLNRGEGYGVVKSLEQAQHQVALRQGVGKNPVGKITLVSSKSNEQIRGYRVGLDGDIDIIHCYGDEL